MKPSGKWYKGECGSCGYKGMVKDWTETFPQERTVALCYVCQNTKAGNAALHPTVYENVGVLEMVAQCTNIILDVISAGRINQNPDG